MYGNNAFTQIENEPYHSRKPSSNARMPGDDLEIMLEFSKSPSLASTAMLVVYQLYLRLLIEYATTADSVTPLPPQSTTSSFFSGNEKLGLMFSLYGVFRLNPKND